jgi:hypothetical protein
MLTLVYIVFAFALLLWIPTLLIGIVFAFLKKWNTVKVCGATLGALTVLIFILAQLEAGLDPKARLAEPATSNTVTTKSSHHNASRVATGMAFPSYLDLHIGQRVILNSNNEGDGTMATLFDDLQTVHKWAQGESDPHALPHHDLPIGTRATVRSWTRVDTVSGDEVTMINVAISNGAAKRGYVQDIGVLPDIPPGSTLVVNSFRGNNTMLKAQQDRTSSINIANGTHVALVSVHPDGRSISPYRGEVLTGPHRGVTGWFNAFELSAPSPRIASGEYDDKCHCISLYMIDRKYAAAHTPTPPPTASPDPGPETDDDKAYMNEACNLMYPKGSGYGFDFGDGSDDHANLRIVTCAGPNADQLMYFRKEHLAESKDQYAHDGKPPGTPGGYEVPAPGTSDATPFP